MSLVLQPALTRQPALEAKLQDMAHRARDAYDGNVEPISGQVKPGPAVTYGLIQHLATFDIASCSVSASACPEQ